MGFCVNGSVVGCCFQLTKYYELIWQLLVKHLRKVGCLSVDISVHLGGERQDLGRDGSSEWSVSLLSQSTMTSLKKKVSILQNTQ